MTRRVAVAVLLVAAVAWGASLAYRWADGPLHRRQVLLAEPLRLEAGTRVAGSFEPDHEGPVVLYVRFDRQRPDQDLGSLIGGGWRGHGEPAGFVASYTIRSRGEVALSGVLDHAFVGASSRTSIKVLVAHLDTGFPQPYEAELRVDRARPELATLSTSFTVEHGGDWIHYAWFDAFLRRALVNLVLVSIAVVAVVRFLVARRRRRRRQSTASQPPQRAS